MRHGYRIAVAYLAISAPACALVSTWLQPAEPPASLMEVAGLRGDLARAAGVVMDDLMAERRRANQEAEAWEAAALDGGPPLQFHADGGPNHQLDFDWRRAMRECFARPHSYDVQVRPEDGGYYARVTPAVERCVSSMSMKGGAAAYHLSGDFTILARDLEE